MIKNNGSFLYFTITQQIQMIFKRRFIIPIFFILTTIEIIFLLIIYIDPLYLISKNKLNMNDTVKERLSIVIAINRKDNIDSLTRIIDFSPAKPYLLTNKTLTLPENKEQIKTQTSSRNVFT